MVVGMNRTPLPQGTLERKSGERFQSGSLFGKEDRIGFSLRGPVDLSTDLFLAPVERPLVGLVNVSEGPAGEEMFFDDGDGTLDLSLLFRIVALRRIGDKVIVSLKVGVRVVEQRIVEVGFPDT